MYIKFKIEKLFYIDNLSEEEKKEYLEKGEKIFSTQKEEVNRKIKEYLLPDKSIDVQRLSENWFKEVEADIFISHSHKDKKEAIILSGILYEKFKLKCFIDSTIWGNSLDLLKEIDENYNKLANGSYSYEGSTWAASNVHLILMIALKKMIDKSECILFLKTPNSIKIDKSINKKENTASPWIFAEIEIANSIEITKPERYKLDSTNKLGYAENYLLGFSYQTNLDEFYDINDEIFEDWLGKRYKNKNALDILYEIIEEKKKEKNDERR